MGWEQAANNWREIPKGMTVRQLWYNPAIVPIYAVVAAAATLNVVFLTKYFMGNCDIHFKKADRMNHEMSVNEGRVAWHNSRVGLRDINKKKLNIFPFSWVPTSETIEKRAA